MRVLVCGGRYYHDWYGVFRALREIHYKNKITLLISGMARGIDTQAVSWARRNGVPVFAFPAQWGRFYRKAGPIRNQLMLDIGKPDLVVQFPGAWGTYDMVRRAEKAKIKVHSVYGY